MPLVMYEYIEVNLIGVVLLLTILFYAPRKYLRNRESGQRYFIRMLVLNALILLADNGIYLLRGRSAPGLILLNHGVCAAYFAMHAWFCYSWVLYVLRRLYPRSRPGLAERWALRLPALVNTALALASPVTGWLYTLSRQNVYHRGPYILVSFGAAILYWLFSSALLLRERLHPSRSRERSEYWTLLLFPLPPLIGNLLQLRFYGLSIVWVCSAISMLILSIDLEKDLLSRDALTGLYNRRQTNAQLAWEAAHLHSAEEPLLVAMLDVNRFKSINDRYGHLAGDQALACVARTLRENCRKSDFVSRFGGDEFLLIGHVRRAEDAENLLARLAAALAAARRKEGLPYPLSASAGFVLYQPGEAVTPDALINAADRAMYARKRMSESDSSPL
jgi:diguanylate cyclase (GGDEF)-like protein